MIKSENKSKIFESSLFWWTNQKATKDTHTPTHTHTEAHLTKKLAHSEN